MEHSRIVAVANQGKAFGVSTAMTRVRTPLVLTRFVEKPDTATAEGYVRSGQYFWNSGMFVLRADVFTWKTTRARTFIPRWTMFP